MGEVPIHCWVAYAGGLAGSEFVDNVASRAPRDTGGFANWFREVVSERFIRELASSDSPVCNERAYALFFSLAPFFTPAPIDSSILVPAIETVKTKGDGERFFAKSSRNACTCELCFVQGSSAYTLLVCLRLNAYAAMLTLETSQGNHVWKGLSCEASQIPSGIAEWLRGFFFL